MVPMVLPGVPIAVLFKTKNILVNDKTIFYYILVDYCNTEKKKTVKC